MGSKFYAKIKESIIEREVEDVYNQGINLYFPNVPITHPFSCDGFLDTKTHSGKILKLIIEYKLDEMLNTKSGRAKVLVQVLFYLKQFEINGMVLPNVCMVGDINECFVIHVNSLLKYLDEDVDWRIAPSKAHLTYPDLVLKIANDEDINPFIFSVDERFSFKEVSQKIEDLADNVQRYVHVTEHNISTIYDYFCHNVIRNVKKIKSHDLVGIFMGVIINGDEYYQHPTKKNTLITPSGTVDINGDGFRAFFGYFQRNYTPQEKNNLTAIADRLIEDTDRRNSGDFWTPTLFVDYAHRMISEQLGEDWKDKYVVWDNCCGTKNLTRDYHFKELYCSTLFDSELETGKRYNKEATTFQFDFLNDPPEKLPQSLLDAFEQDKPIVFFLNPPYRGATGRNGAAVSLESLTSKQMKKEGIGRSALSDQFLYRICRFVDEYHLTNCCVALFSGTGLMRNTGSKGIRKYFGQYFQYDKGILFNASHFADVSDTWGISDGEVNAIDTKTLYNIDDETSMKEWIRTDENYTKKSEIIRLRLGLVPEKNDTIKIPDDYIANYVVSRNSNDPTNRYNFFYSGKYQTDSKCQVNITKANFDNCAASFAVRGLAPLNWISGDDEFMAPDEQHPLFSQFEKDAVIYSLFRDSYSYQTSVKLDYLGKHWNIKNEFFWMSKNEIADLANEYQLDDVYEDAKTSDERYVYKYIQDHRSEFSPEASAALNKANELVEKSFRYRQLFAEEHPEYQVDKVWDAGYYQLKPIWKEYLKDDFNEFKTLYKALVDKMRPMVYELGFLRK